MNTKGLIVTGTGRYFDYNNINKDNIHIDDIINSLSRINRFIGHSHRAYSVSEHTIYCYAMSKEAGFSDREKLLVLLHDFPEAYIGDFPSPLKDMLPELSNIEEKIELALYNHLNIKPPTKEEYNKIKSIDITMLLVEMKYLTHHNYKIDDSKIKIYREFLDDSKFELSDVSPTEKSLNVVLRSIFNSLLELNKRG